MIKLFNVVLRENPIDSPFAPKNKCGDILPFLGFMGDALGASLNQDNVNATNATNLKIAEINNMREQQQFEENMNWLRYQYNKNRQFALEDRDYNSPVKIVQRLQQAGINPSSYFGQGATQIASSQGVGAPSPSNFHSPIMQASTIGSDLGGAVGRAVNAYNQSRLATSEVRKNEATSNNIEASTSSMNQKLPYEIDKLKADSYKEGIEGDFARKQLDFYGATMDLRQKLLYGDLMQQDQSLKNMQEEFRTMQLQNDINQIVRAYRSKLEEANIALIWNKCKEVQANIGLINANEMLSQTEREKRVQEVINQKIVNGLGSIDFEVKKALKDEFIEQGKYQTHEQKWRAVDMFMHSGRGYGGTDRPLWQSFVETADDFEKYTRKFGKNRIVGR